MIDYQEKHQVVAGVDATGGYSSGDKKTLDIGEILTHSQTLNTASQSLTSICDNMYNTIISLEENESFKSKFASAGYYEKFNTLNGQVPKFTEGVLKFSKFLSDYLIGNYQDTDDEMKSLIEATLNDSLSQLAAIGVLGGTVDMTKISATAQGAISGEGWIDPGKINTEAFSDTGNLDFVTREDGSVMITRNGVPIGFTTEEALKPNESAATSVTDEKIISQADYDKLPDFQKQIVDSEGYKVVSEYPKTQGTGQDRADSYDGSASSNTTNEDFMDNQMMRNNPDIAKASELASDIKATAAERTSASQTIAQNEISSRQERLKEIEKESLEAYNNAYNNPNASYSEQDAARVKMDLLKYEKEDINNELADLNSGKILDLKPYLDQKADIPVANAKEFTKPGIFNDWSLNGIEKLVYDDKSGKYKAYDANGKYQLSFGLDYLEKSSINYKD